MRGGISAPGHARAAILRHAGRQRWGVDARPRSREASMTLETPMSTGASLRLDGARDVATPRRDAWLPIGVAMVALVSACAPAVRQTSPAAPDGLPRAHDAPDEAATTPSTEAPADSAPSATHPAVRPGPPFEELRGWTTDDHQAALDSFRRSCAVVMARADTSALTEPSDWQEACGAAVGTVTAREFFEQHFLPVIVEDGTGLHTGYYEPEIAASRTKSSAFRHPIYKRPSDLIVVAGGPVRYCARWDGTTCAPYFSRAEIEDGALARRRLEMAYAADPYELFIMHMQGSGRLRMQDGSFVRVGFDGYNGREWSSIAPKVKKELNGREWPMDTDGILAWLRSHPKQARASSWYRNSVGRSSRSTSRNCTCGEGAFFTRTLAAV
jgi:membrane-bound lytic murein transglycosylase A